LKKLSSGGLSASPFVRSRLSWYPRKRRDRKIAIAANGRSLLQVALDAEFGVLDCICPYDVFGVPSIPTRKKRLLVNC
ncbi:MAG: hypothetical protein KDA60_22310, partial [Planctomycetales bacterium]|nr:hypothetical protein [Planctomycetales bacterium]